MVLVVMGGWFVWTVTDLPPVGEMDNMGAMTNVGTAGTEAATNHLLTTIAVLGTLMYAVSAWRYWGVFRHSRTLLPITVVACFVLLAEAMIGVAVTGERKWHASWWEWHGLIVSAYLIVGLAARREWRDERFRRLYLATTRERHQDVSVLFADLVGFTGFAERESPTDAAAVLDAYWSIAAPLITQRFGGELDAFAGDGFMATFNNRGDQPDHAQRASCAALALQRSIARLAEQHPGWPRMRVGVNSGGVIVREVGGDGHIAYPVVGDMVNTGARLESMAPVGGVLIGAETYARLPAEAVVEEWAGVRVKGKQDAVDAYVLHSSPC